MSPQLKIAEQIQHQARKKEKEEAAKRQQKAMDKAAAEREMAAAAAGANAHPSASNTEASPPEAERDPSANGPDVDSAAAEDDDGNIREITMDDLALGQLQLAYPFSVPRKEEQLLRSNTIHPIPAPHLQLIRTTSTILLMQTRVRRYYCLHQH